MSGAAKFAVLAAVLVGCWLIGSPGAWAAGGTSTELAADRQLINVLRGDLNRTLIRHCRDEQTRWFWPDVRRIPAGNVKTNQAFLQARIGRVRSFLEPHAVCWLSHQWAESRAGRCVSSREGGLRSVSWPSGMYHGKWQMDAAFERTYGRVFRSQWGRASRWPEWAQDVAGWRGYRARGWWPWPSTARSCGLLP